MLRRTLLATTLLTPLALPLGCGDDAAGNRSPYAGIEPSQTLAGVGLSAPVDLVRDEHGIPHIYAQTELDAAYANGYVVASDRWMQLDLLRHVAKGRVAELFGGLDASQVVSDLVMRMHDFGGRADAQFAALQGSSEADAVAAAAALQRFADGVNAVIAEFQAGTRELDDAQAAFLNPETLLPWEPSDSVAIGLLQAWSLSYDDTELDLSAARDAGVAGFAESADSDRQARARAFDDLFPLEQLDHVSTIDGWPDGSSAARRARAAAVAPTTTRVPKELLEQLKITRTPVEVMGLQFPHPENGSNNWVVGPDLAGGKALLANDPHLQLSNPPMFHAVHITVPGALDVSGISLSGVPGVVLGHTAGVAWGATTAYHDVVDFHLETIAPCSSGSGDCVTYDGEEVQLERRTEHFKVGTLGLITEEFDAVYEVVPHHGPILPVIGPDNRIVPRTGDSGISVQYTAYQQTNEILALYRLNRAQSVAEGFAALDVFDHGAQNWVMIDRDHHIGWTTSSQMPVRSEGCLTWDPETGEGDAPFFVLPGDGSCVWEGNLDEAFVPHAIDPDKGYLVTANADPVGETFDGNPINGPHYAGYDYGPGFREGRITRRLEALKDDGAAMTLDDMASVQADTHSNSGHRLRPFIVAAVDALAAEAATPGTHPDLEGFAASLDAGELATLVDLRDRLDAWTLATPPATDTDDAGEIADSTATTIFNFWQIEFYAAAFSDELGVLGSFPQRGFTIAAAIKALEEPASLKTGTAPGYPDSALLCDDLDTVGTIETCQYMIVLALQRAAAQGTSRFGSSNPDAWRWGQLHVATINALLPVDALDLPGEDQTYPRPGDTHAVDASNNSVASYTFAYAHGPAMRNLVSFGDDGAIEHRWALPGGQVFDLRSPHFRDLADQYWTKNQYLTVPWLTPEIIDAAEERWVFEPGAAAQ